MSVGHIPIFFAVYINRYASFHKKKNQSHRLIITFINNKTGKIPSLPQFKG